MWPTFRKLTSEEKDQLAASFREAVQREFAFLVGDYGFHPAEEEPTWIRYAYRSAEVFVHIYHEYAFNLTLSVGLEPATNLANGEPVNRNGYGLPSIVECFAGPDHLPSDVKTWVERGRHQHQLYNPWAVADTPELVQPAVARMAELTKQFAVPLLIGDRSAFHRIDEFTKHEQTERTRRMLLEGLPPDIAADSKDKSVPELYALRDAILKKRGVI